MNHPDVICLVCNQGPKPCYTQYNKYRKQIRCGYGSIYDDCAFHLLNHDQRIVNASTDEYICDPCVLQMVKNHIMRAIPSSNMFPENYCDKCGKWENTCFIHSYLEVKLLEINRFKEISEGKYTHVYKCCELHWDSLPAWIQQHTILCENCEDELYDLGKPLNVNSHNFRAEVFKRGPKALDIE